MTPLLSEPRQDESFPQGGVDRWQSPRFPFPAWNHKKAVQQLENAEQQGSFFVSESYPQ